MPAVQFSFLNIQGWADPTFTIFFRLNLQIIFFFDIQINYYTMYKRPYNIFNPESRKIRQGVFGQQIQAGTRFGIGKGKVLYRVGEHIKAYQTKANQYIDNYPDRLKDFDIFKSTLRQKVINGKQSVKSYNLQQISGFFPWVMSCQFMFQPFRTILYCIKTGIQPQKVWVVMSQLHSSLINEVVNDAVFQSVKYGSPYLQTAKQVFKSNNAGRLTLMFSSIIKSYQSTKAYFTDVFKRISEKTAINWDDQDSKLKTVAKAIVAGTKKIWDFFIPANWGLGTKWDQTLDKELLKQTKEQTQWKKTILDVVQQIFKDLRCYGEIVIHFGYIKHSALKKVIQGQIYYYFIDQPNLLITVNNSFPSVYRNVKGQLILIPESMFTKDFLRGMITAQVLQMGGRMFKQIKRDSTLTQQEKQPFQSFATKYLPPERATKDSFSAQQWQAYEKLRQNFGKKPD